MKQAVSNAEFVDAVCHSYDPKEETPALGITHNYRGSVVYPARRLIDCDPQSMQHLSVGLYDPQKGKRFHRRKAFWTGATCLVLDDIKEKSPEPKLRPSWIMETKPGSEQWGYIFSEVVRDDSEFEAMIRAVCNSGRSDPGMNDIIRWFRLPGSQPIGKQFPARLIFWEPERQFPPSKLLRGLGVQHVSKARPATPVRVGTDVSDELFEWLRENGYLGERDSNGWWECLCPLGHEHSDGKPHGHYKPAVNDDARRAFKCFHGHSRTSGPPRTADFLRWVAKQGGPHVGLYADDTELAQRMERIAQGYQRLPVEVRKMLEAGNGY